MSLQSCFSPTTTPIPPTLLSSPGILQVAEGKDLETAISYFKEAATGSPVAAARSRALKYLVLGCLLQKRPSDAHKAARSPVHLADLDDGVLAMLAVADSATTASVKQFRSGWGQSVFVDLAF